jgi:Spy/CpxP family protein refolding chaperone
MAKFSALSLAALLCCNAAAFAVTAKTAAPPPPKADPALLEFLGSWQSSDGKWVDPMTFARFDPARQAAEHARHAGKPLTPPKGPNPGGTPPGGDESRGL